MNDNRRGAWQPKRIPGNFPKNFQGESIARVQVGVSGHGEVKRNVGALLGGLLGFGSTLLVLNDRQRKASIGMHILVERAS